jgi:peptidoglycan/LPS O-acetylase OafA/YrhL
MLSIVLFHCLQPVAVGVWGQLIELGAAGVHAFLFLSGFGLMLSYGNRPLHGFYRRRFRRILVPYFVFVTLLFVVNQWWPIYPEDGVYAYLGHVLLFKMFDESIISSYGYHLWFLSTIVQFYLVFPALRWCLKRWGMLLTFSLAAAVSVGFSVLIVALGRADQRIFNGCFLVYLWEFVLGMIAAERYRVGGTKFWEVSPSWLLPITGMALAFAALVGRSGSDALQLVNNPAALVGFGGLLVAAYQFIAWRNWSLCQSALQWFGGISYEVYLVHGLIQTRAFFWLEPQHLIAKLATCGGSLLVVVVAGQLFHHLLTREPSVRTGAAI